MPFYYQHHGKAAPNKWVAFWRKVYNPLGFQKGYNFPLWFIFCGAALGFCASRTIYLNYDTTFKMDHLISGDWLHMSKGIIRTGTLVHLSAVVPIGFLLPLQFLPIVRYKAMLFHRITGYLLISLLLVGNAGAIIMCTRALGGSVDVQTLTGMLALMTTGSALLAYINIKRLQIDQHRAWMMRCWSYAFIIITLRIIQVPMMQLVGLTVAIYIPMDCETIDFSNSKNGDNLAAKFYPACEIDHDSVIGVLADFTPQPHADGLFPLHQIGAAIRASFGPAAFLAIAIHAILIELYLHLTQAESARLKRVSYERQKARGWKRPGDASWLTRETWGDMEPFDYTKQPENKDTTPKNVNQDGDESELNDTGEAHALRPLVNQSGAGQTTAALENQPYDPHTWYRQG
uniref:Microtubule associated protein n=1 Tax=Bionectria ochroleuca TaxID=29856 RepID=A0A8H7MYL6_BIOOC